MVAPFQAFCLLSFITWIYAINDNDIKECGFSRFGRVMCRSVNVFYKECLVPGATSVEAIKLHQQISEAACQFKSTFGFRENVVWVTDGCSGEFLICYRGDPQPTDRAPTNQPVTGSPLTSSTTPKTGITENGIVRETNVEPDYGKAGLYTGVILGVLAFVGAGVLIGFVIIKRQTKEKTRHLVEERQKKLDANHPDLNAIEIPVTFKHQRKHSTDSATVSVPDQCHVTTRDLGKPYHTVADRGLPMYGSARSYSSGRFATSGKSFGRLTRSHTSSNRRSSITFDRKTFRSDTVPHRINKAMSDPALFKSSYCSSQSSLGSISEENQLDDLSSFPDANSKQTALVKPLWNNTTHFTTPCFRIDGSESNRTDFETSMLLGPLRQVDTLSVRSKSPSESSAVSQVSSSSIVARRQHRSRTVNRKPVGLSTNQRSYYDDDLQPSVLGTFSKQNETEPQGCHLDHVSHGSDANDRKPSSTDDPPPLIFVVPETRISKRPYDSEYANPNEMNGPSFINLGYYDDNMDTGENNEGQCHSVQIYVSREDDSSDIAQSRDQFQRSNRPVSPVVVVTNGNSDVIYSEIQKPKPYIKPIPILKPKPKIAPKPKGYIPNAPHYARSCLKTEKQTDSPISPLNVSFDDEVHQNGEQKYFYGKESGKYGQLTSFKPVDEPYSETLRKAIIRGNTRRLQLKEGIA